MTQRERLETARQALLLVHHAILGVERVAYERAFGRIEGDGTLLQLVIHDPWFAWLRPISALIVRIDESLDAEGTDGEALLAAVREQLRPLERGTEFQARYHRLLQQEPAVVLAHAAARKLVDP